MKYLWIGTHLLKVHADPLFFVNDEYFDRFIRKGEGPIHEEEELAWVKLLGKEEPKAEKTPERKLTRMEFYEKFGY